jgi:hypothetical protein
MWRDPIAAWGARILHDELGRRKVPYVHVECGVVGGVQLPNRRKMLQEKREELLNGSPRRARLKMLKQPYLATVNCSVYPLAVPVEIGSCETIVQVGQTALVVAFEFVSLPTDNLSDLLGHLLNSVFPLRRGLRNGIEPRRAGPHRQLTQPIYEVPDLPAKQNQNRRNETSGNRGPHKHFEVVQDQPCSIQSATSGADSSPSRHCSTHRTPVCRLPFLPIQWACDGVGV